METPEPNADTFPGDRDQGKTWWYRRGEKLVRMKIRTRINNKQIGQWLLKTDQDNIVDLRKHEAEEMLRQSLYWNADEDGNGGGEAERIRDAKEECEREIMAELRETHKGDLNNTEFRKYFDKVLAKSHDERNVDEKALIADMDTLRQRTGWSTEKCFFRRWDRGISPILSAEILDNTIKPPIENQDLSQAEMLMAAALKTLGATGTDETARLLRELNDKLEAQAAEIERLKRGRKG